MTGMIKQVVPLYESRILTGMKAKLKSNRLLRLMDHRNGPNSIFWMQRFGTNPTKRTRKTIHQRVRDKVLFIRENPYAYSVQYDNTRCAVLDIFPFLVHYVVDEQNKIIIVISVFHTSLNPDR